MINYTYPTTKELQEIAPEKVMELERDRPTFKIFPDRETNMVTLEWTQKDNWRGIQQLRGLNGEPTYVKMVGERRFRATPGYFGEFMTVDEEMMTNRADRTPEGRPVNISDLVAERQDYLLERERNVKEYTHWKAILDGQFTFVNSANGAYYHDEFSIQTVTMSDWSDHDNATPIADLLGAKLLGRGKSVSFGTGSEYFMNTVTLNHMLRNNNPDDLGGHFAITVGGTKQFKTQDEVNSTLASMGLGTIREYDESYLTDAGSTVQWIPDDKVAFVGRRTDGSKIGEYRLTRNPNNDMKPGSYSKVFDRKDRIPRLIEVHQGHNGGLVIFYGSALGVGSC